MVLPVGQDATLSCVAEGNPEPTISPLNNNVTFTNGQYQFTEPTSTDSGVYGCRASSSSVGYVDTFYTVYFAGMYVRERERERGGGGMEREGGVGGW